MKISNIMNTDIEITYLLILHKNYKMKNLMCKIFMPPYLPPSPFLSLLPVSQFYLKLDQ